MAGETKVGGQTNQQICRAQTMIVKRITKKERGVTHCLPRRFVCRVGSILYAVYVRCRPPVTSSQLFPSSIFCHFLPNSLLVLRIGFFHALPSLKKERNETFRDAGAGEGSPPPTQRLQGTDQNDTH